jgi:hypothetical protein
MAWVHIRDSQLGVSAELKLEQSGVASSHLSQPMPKNMCPIVYPLSEYGGDVDMNAAHAHTQFSFFLSQTDLEAWAGVS